MSNLKLGESLRSSLLVALIIGSALVSAANEQPIGPWRRSLSTRAQPQSASVPSTIGTGSAVEAGSRRITRTADVFQAGKTSQYQATKTHWYQPPTTTTPRPAPIIQQEQQYEQQQSEQYVERQQPQIEYGAAPVGQAEPFAFDFKTEDNSGNGQYRKEESDKNGVVRGSYGYTDASGIYRHVEYVADQNGFRANIKSNEPGLIGETQPASIQMGAGSAPSPGSQRLSAPVAIGTNSGADNGEWISASASNNQGSSSADLALAPPDFESSHKAERLRRNPRNFRN